LKDKTKIFFAIFCILLVGINIFLLFNSLNSKDKSSENTNQELTSKEPHIINKDDKLDTSQKQDLSIRELDRKYEDRFNMLAKNYEREITFREADYQHTFNRILTIIALTFTILALFIALINFTGINKFRENIEQQANENVRKATSPDEIAKLIQSNSKEAIEKLEKEFAFEVNKKMKEIESYTTSLYDAVSTGKEKVESSSKEFENYAEVNKYKLETFVKNLKEVKVEKEYTALDWVLKAKNEGIQKNYEEVIKITNEALIQYPTNDEIYFERASAYYELKDYKNAIDSYTNSIKFDKNNSIYFNNRGAAYFYLKNYKKAISDYSAAIKLTNNNPLYFFNRGNAYYQLRNFEKAIENYSEAIKLKSNNPDYFKGRGNAYQGLADFERAIEDYNEAIRLNRNKPEYFKNRGSAYLGLENFEKAIEDYTYAFNLNPNDGSYLIGRGDAYFQLNKFLEAEKNYIQSYNLKSDSAIIRLLRFAILQNNFSNVDQYLREENSYPMVPQVKIFFYFYAAIIYCLQGKDYEYYKNKIEDYDKTTLYNSWNSSLFDKWLNSGLIPPDKINSVTELVNLIKSYFKPTN